MLYSLWLHVCLSYNSKNIRDILQFFGSAENVFAASSGELEESGLFSKKELVRLADKDLAEANRITERCAYLGYRIYCLDGEDYPLSLKSISDPPTVIFTSGDVSAFDKRAVAVVGARNPTLTGKKTAFDISYDLASRGFVIVSGGAEGIDTQAHKGALQSGGLTVCVLGGGLNHKYLVKNASLRDEIAKHGLLVTEYPPDMEPTSYTFPRRNRIISALSECTVVVEASMGSGSLITAGDAREQGKLLFAVPGSIDSYSSSGTNKMLTEGAFAALSADDIMKRLDSHIVEESEIDSSTIKSIRQEGKNAKNTKTGRKSEPKKKTDRPKTKTSLLNLNENKAQKPEKQEKDDNFLSGLLTENAMTVYHTIPETPFFADSLSEELDIEIGQLLSALTELEIMGLIKALPGGRYEKI